MRQTERGGTERTGQLGAFLLALALLLVLTADSFFTVRLLRRTHNVDLLGLPNLLAALR